MGEQPLKPKPIKVFISYAPEDEPHRDEFLKHLAALRRGGALETWHRGKIPPGTRPQTFVDEHLGVADVILLLVTPDYLASDELYGEMNRAAQRGTRREAMVISLIVRPVDVHASPLVGFPAIPSNGVPITTWENQDAAWHAVAQDLRIALLGARPDLGRSLGERIRASVVFGAGAGTVGGLLEAWMGDRERALITAAVCLLLGTAVAIGRGRSAVRVTISITLGISFLVAARALTGFLADPESPHVTHLEEDAGPPSPSPSPSPSLPTHGIAEVPASRRPPPVAYHPKYDPAPSLALSVRVPAGFNAALMRDSPGFGSRVVGSVPNGALVKRLGPVKIIRGSWHNVDYKGQSGWMHQDVLDLKATASFLASAPLEGRHPAPSSAKSASPRTLPPPKSEGLFDRFLEDK